jgi:hypothetical protein
MARNPNLPNVDGIIGTVVTPAVRYTLETARAMAESINASAEDGDLVMADVRPLDLDNPDTLYVIILVDLEEPKGSPSRETAW